MGSTPFWLNPLALLGGGSSGFGGGYGGGFGSGSATPGIFLHAPSGSGF